MLGLGWLVLLHISRGETGLFSKYLRTVQKLINKLLGILTDSTIMQKQQCVILISIHRNCFGKKYAKKISIVGNM